MVPDIPLAQGDAKFWVQTWNPSGYGPWSDAMTFKVPAPVLPGKVTLVSPLGISNTNPPVYFWTAEAHSTWYYLWVSDSTGNKIAKWYSALGADCGSGTGTCAASPLIPLAIGGYKWWVQTWSPNGSGPWSDPMVFTVLPQSP